MHQSSVVKRFLPPSVKREAQAKLIDAVEMLLSIFAKSFCGRLIVFFLFQVR